MMVMEFLGIAHVARRVKEWSRNDKAVSRVWEAEARRRKTHSICNGAAPGERSSRSCPQNLENKLSKFGSNNAGFRMVL